MKLLRLQLQEAYKSLPAGFEIHFHEWSEKGQERMQSFQPFCFAGLNGSGKSNVLEVLSHIFYHLEFCVAEFRPDSFEQQFDRTVSIPDAYELEYLIGDNSGGKYSLEQLDKVIIKKEAQQAPILKVQAYPFGDTEPIQESKSAFVPNEKGESIQAKQYLPDIVVGYSSGENETLSMPFLKNRLINFDKYKEDYKEEIKFEEPETSLIYIDESMSQAVLLAVLLFEEEQTLAPLKKELGIVSMQSFTMNLNHQIFEWRNEQGFMEKHPVIGHVKEEIEQLKQIATCCYEQEPTEEQHGYLSLDFWVNKATRGAFQKQFNNSFDFFRFLQVLYELNAFTIPAWTKEDVYGSKGYYTRNKLPIVAPTDTVFHFLDFKIKKKIKGEEKPIPLLLREFSDGEHQFLHTIGICLMLKDRRSLLLLDEPETHFNPAWRAKFVKTLSDSITAGSPTGLEEGQIHLLKDVILTSHSPFIISDCMPSHVLLFSRNEHNQVQAKNVRELDFNTYGTSVELILSELFDYDQTIGDLAKEEILQVDFEEIQQAPDVEAAVQAAKRKLHQKLGESIEKDLVLAQLNRIKREAKENNQ